MANYSREASNTLPATAADLTTIYSAPEVAAVLTVDGNRVGISGTDKYLLHEFKVDGSGKKTGTGTVTGRSNINCADSIIYLQAYDTGSGWTTIDSDSSTVANSDFTLTYDFATLESYKDGSGIITLRVYQLSGNIPPAFNTIYHVDPDGGGEYTNLSQVYNNVTGDQSNNAILLKRGAVFSGQSLVLNCYGTPGQPLTIGNYSDPLDPSDVLPIIDGHTDVTAGTFTLSSGNVYTGPNIWPTWCYVAWKGSASGTHAGLLYKNTSGNYASLGTNQWDINGSTLYINIGGTDPTGLNFFYSNQDASIDLNGNSNITIDGIEGRFNGSYKGFVFARDVANITVKNCVAEPYGDGVRLDFNSTGCSNILVDNCNFWQDDENIKAAGFCGVYPLSTNGITLSNSTITGFKHGICSATYMESNPNNPSLPDPNNPPAGSVTAGNHRIKFTMLTATGETRLEYTYPDMTVIPGLLVNADGAHSIDIVIYNGTAAVTGKNIYMTTAGGSTYYKVTAGSSPTISGNVQTTYTINVTDAELVTHDVAPTVNTTSIAVYNMVVHDCNLVNNGRQYYYNITPGLDEAAIYFAAGGTHWLGDDVGGDIEFKRVIGGSAYNNTITNAYAYGIASYGGQNLNAYNNTINGSGINAIIWNGCDNCWAYRNLVINGGNVEAYSWGPLTFEKHNGNSGFYYNIVINSQNCPTGVAINNHQAGYIYVENNTIYNCGKADAREQLPTTGNVGWTQNGSVWSHSTAFGYNILEDNVLLTEASTNECSDGNYYYDGSILYYKPTDAPTGQPKDHTVESRYYNDTYGSIYINNGDVNGASTTAVIKNNIFVAPSGVRFVYRGSNSTVDMTNNCYYTSGTSEWKDSGNSYGSLAAWNTATGIDANSKDQNPLVTNPSGTTAADYQIPVGSPCVDAGATLSLTGGDYGGRAISGVRDIGAWEYIP